MCYLMKKFILFSRESSSMVSTWTDTIYCSILKNKSLTWRKDNTDNPRGGVRGVIPNKQGY